VRISSDVAGPTWRCPSPAALAESLKPQVGSAIESNWRTIWIADAHRDEGKRLVVRADEKLTAFIELESAIRGCGELA
jgi:hypothetical protein